jgi:XapX domain-containing protein
VVGAAYGLVQVSSPVPPMIALVGLFGMLPGQQAVDMAKRHFVPSAQTSIKHDGAAPRVQIHDAPELNLIGIRWL